MAILNYTTKIDSDKTIMEIQKILVKHGATKIVADYEDGIPVALTFSLMIGDKMAGFSLPCNYEGVLRAMTADRKVPRSSCTKEQAFRVCWRILKDWIEAQTALIEAQLAELPEIFLPYAVTKNGNTLYNEIKGSDILLLN